MKKLYASFILGDEKLSGYIDGYTIYGEHDYAMVFVPEKEKIYSIKVQALEISGYQDV